MGLTVKSVLLCEMIKQNQQLHGWLLAVGVALLFAFRYGYQFGTTDHEELLPPLYQLANPELYPHDFFMQHYLQGFNIRYYFIKILYAFQVVLPLQDLFFSIWLLCLVLLNHIWYRIALLITNTEVSALLAPIAILFATYNFTLGGNSITYNMLIPAVPAKVLASLGLLYFLQRRFLFASIAFGIGSLFQILSSMQPYILCVMVMLYAWRTFTLKQIISMLVGGIIPLVLVIIPMWQSGYFTGASPEQKQLANQILFTMRIPWHHLPSAFGFIQFAKFSSIVVVALWIIRKTKLSNTSPHIKTVTIFILIQLCIALLYYVLVEQLNVLGFAASQWFKSSMWVVAFATIILVHAGARVFQQKLFLKHAIAMVWVGVVFCCVWVALPQLPYAQKMRNRIQYHIHEPTDLTQMHIWIKQHTPVQSLFHIPPDNLSFASQAQRSTWVSTHAFVHRTTSILDWHQRYAIAYGVSVENLHNSHFRHQALAHFYSQPKPTIACDYWLFDTTQLQVEPIYVQRIHQIGTWLLVKP